MRPASTQLPETVPLPLIIRRYFEVALYLLVFTGFGTLASTGGLDIATVLLVGAVLLFRGYLLAERRSLVIPERWTTILTVGYVVFYVADYFLISGSFLNATVHLVLFVMLVRLFSAQRDRDHYFLSVISFLMVLAAAVLTVDSTFLLAFAGFMLMAVVTFVLMEMTRASAKAPIHAEESRDPWIHRRIAFSLARMAPVLVGIILLVAAAIFFLLPRVSAGYLSAYAPGHELTTGFSDRVELGRIGEIQQSSAVVMHIQIDGDEHGAFDLKWRGITLNLFDGRNWSNPQEQRVVTRNPGGHFTLWPLSRSAQTPVAALKSSHLIHYRVLMEPVGTNVFFLAPTPRTLDGVYSLLAIDNGGAVFDLDTQHLVNRYEASSDISEPVPADLRVAMGSYPPDAFNYLQLPPLDPRIPKLAAEITARAGNDYDKAIALDTYLRTHFGYTLQLSNNVPRDPLANFLFERKQGHCEYFASSMAVMLRTLHIPSRVVNGFRTGEFNDLTSQYLVRASNAHSWVEAYFPGQGWVSFDPTPAGPKQVYSNWNRVLMYADAMASFWRDWVVSYDMGHQQNLGQEATRGGRALFHHLRNWAHRRYLSMLGTAENAKDAMSHSPQGWIIAAAVATLLLLLGANAQRIWRAVYRGRVAARPEQAPRQAATIWYERMTRLVGRRGWRKSPAQTPKEFVISISDAALRGPVTEFTQHYEHARFGDSTEDARRLPELYQEVSQQLQRQAK